ARCRAQRWRSHAPHRSGQRTVRRPPDGAARASRRRRGQHPRDRHRHLRLQGPLPPLAPGDRSRRAGAARLPEQPHPPDPGHHAGDDQEAPVPNLRKSRCRFTGTAEQQTGLKHKEIDKLSGRRLGAGDVSTPALHFSLGILSDRLILATTKVVTRRLCMLDFPFRGFALKAFGLSETGPVRHMNEDCFVSAEDLRLFVVADGMGGHAAGEVAAKLAVESIENFIRRSHETTDFSWPYGIDPTLSYEANRLKTAVSLANRRINRMAENHE